MPVCPTCGASTAPGPACGACGALLPATAASPLLDLVPLKTVAGVLLGVGIFVAMSGLVFMTTAMAYWFFFAPSLLFGFAVLLVGAAIIVAASFLLARQQWAWGLAVGVVAFGLVYAVAGLARGYSSGLIGLAVWGGLAYGLWREDVRAPLTA